MKTKLISLIMLLTMIVSVTRAAAQTAVVEASGVGTQNFFIGSLSEQPNIVFSTDSDGGIFQIPAGSLRLRHSSLRRNN